MTAPPAAFLVAPRTHHAQPVAQHKTAILEPAAAAAESDQEAATTEGRPGVCVIF